MPVDDLKTPIRDGGVYRILACLKRMVRGDSYCTAVHNVIDSVFVTTLQADQAQRPLVQKVRHSNADGGASEAATL
jgi:hypothetical protein